MILILKHRNLATILGFIGTFAIFHQLSSQTCFSMFCISDGDLAMLHDISRGQVKAVFPEYGGNFPSAAVDQPGVRVLTSPQVVITTKARL